MPKPNEPPAAPDVAHPNGTQSEGARGEALQAALARRRPDLAGVVLEPLDDTGLAHDHYRLQDTELLLRVPKQSQRGYAAAENLAYQAACFARVAASGHGPGLHAVLEPGEGLPMGALLVDFVAGRPPRLPDDLPALAEAMAAVHALALPPAAERPPLEDHRDPVAGALAEIEAQAPYLESPEVPAGTRAQILEELAWARAYAAASEPAAQPRSLVLTDTHPGNFLVRADGRAVIVDLEKALYGAPAIDLAHATVYTSTTWDVASSAELTVGQVAGFYRSYLASLAPATAARLAPTLVPLRRLLLLRALTWCALWRVEHRQEIGGWAAGRSAPALIAHVEERTRHYLEPATVRRLRGEWLDPPGLDSLLR
jgi:aminoglycoside phosphotransferase (APT) family kinase protein